MRNAVIPLPELRQLAIELVHKSSPIHISPIFIGEKLQLNPTDSTPIDAPQGPVDGDLATGSSSASGVFGQSLPSAIEEGPLSRIKQLW